MPNILIPNFEIEFYQIMIVTEDKKIALNKNLEVGTLSPIQREAFDCLENLNFPFPCI